MKNLTRQARKNIEKDIAKRAKKNPKQFWKYVNSKTKTRQGISQLYMPDKDKLTENDSEKADTLLEHFTSVFTHEPIGPIPKPLQQECQSVLMDIYITEDQIKRS